MHFCSSRFLGKNRNELIRRRKQRKEERKRKPKIKGGM
jgi:hypothetical protein